MYLTGKFRTENNRTMNFEFQTKELPETIGSRTEWTDDTYHAEGILKINGIEINPYKIPYYVITNAFQDHMYENAVVTEINEFKLDKFDQDEISYNVGEQIEYDEEMKEWYLDSIGEDCLNPDTIGDRYNWYVEEYVYNCNNFNYIFDWGIRK